MSDQDWTDYEMTAIYLADVITTTLEDIADKLEVPVEQLAEDLVPHQPFLVAKMCSDDDKFLNSIVEKTNEAGLIHLQPCTTIH